MKDGKRLLAILLAATIMITSSGFTTLAEGITSYPATSFELDSTYNDYDRSKNGTDPDSLGTPATSDGEPNPSDPEDPSTPATPDGEPDPSDPEDPSTPATPDGEPDPSDPEDPGTSEIPSGGTASDDSNNNIQNNPSNIEKVPAPHLSVHWLAGKNSVHLSAFLENSSEDTVAEVTIRLDAAEAAALQSPLPEGILLHEMDQGGAELCFTLSASSLELSEEIDFSPSIPELTVEVAQEDVSVKFEGMLGDQADYSFEGEALSFTPDGTCDWTLEATAQEEEILWTETEPQDLHFTVTVNPAAEDDILPTQQQKIDFSLTLPAPFSFGKKSLSYDQSSQQITLDDIPAVGLSGLSEKENYTVTGLSLEEGTLSFTLERAAKENEPLTLLELTLTVYGKAVSIERPEATPSVLQALHSLTHQLQTAPSSETFQVLLDASLTSVPFAGEAYVGKAAGTASLSLRAIPSIRQESFEKALKGKIFWCDGYEREFRPATYGPPILQFVEVDENGQPLENQDWSVPSASQLAAMGMESLPDIYINSNGNQSSWEWSVAAGTLPTKVITSDIFGDKTTRYYKWQVRPAEEVEHYMLMEITKEQIDQGEITTVSEPGWYYMLLDDYKFDITLRWGTRGEEGGQPGVTDAILNCLDLRVHAGNTDNRHNLLDMKNHDQVKLETTPGVSHPNYGVFTILGIPKYNIDNTLISYTVEPKIGHDEKLDETELVSLKDGDWYAVSYDNTGTSHGSVTDKVYDGGHIYFTLSGTTEFSANKVWLDGGNIEGRPKEGLFQLWRYREGQPYTSAAPVRDSDGKILETVLSTEHDELYIEFAQVDMNGDGIEDPLPKYDSEGYRYIYVMREYLEGENAENYEQVFAAVSEDDQGTVVYTDSLPQTETGLPKETVRPTASRGNDNTFVYDGGTISNRRKGSTSATAIKSWKAAAFQAQLDDVRVEFTLQCQPKEENPSAENEWQTVMDSNGNPVTIEMECFTAEDLAERSETRGASKYGPFGHELEYRWVESGVYQKGADGLYGDNLLSDGTFTLKQDNRDILYRSESEVYQADDGSWVTKLENSIANTIDYHVEKVWLQGLDPATKPITLQLYLMRSDGTVGDPLCEFVLDGNNDGSPTTVTIDGFGSFTVQEGQPKDPAEVNHATNIWTADFGDLPQYDSSGRIYEYVLLEKTNLGDGYLPKYETTKDKDGNYTTILTNGPGEGNQILVRKSWIDDGDSLHREAVTIGVYHKQKMDPTTNAPLRVAEATLENGIWLVEVGIGNNLPSDVFLVEEKLGGKKLDFEDYLNGTAKIQYAEGAYHLYEVTHSNMEELAGAPCYTVTNRRLGNIDITVTKHWNDGGNNGARIQEALQEIPEAERPSLVLRLELDNPRDNYDIRLNEKENYHEISLGSDYIPVRDNGGNLNAENGGTPSTILRVLEFGEEKQDQKYYFSCLPKYDLEGRVAHYTVDEIWVNSDGEPADLSELANQSSSKEKWQNLLDVWEEYSSSVEQTDYIVGELHNRDAQTMLATNSRIGSKEVCWHKQWQDTYAYEHGTRPDLYLDLYRYTPNPNLSDSEKLTLYRSNYRWRPVENEDNTGSDNLYDEKWHWHAVFSSLPKYDADGYEYIYYAIEHTSVNASDFDYLPAQYKKPGSNDLETIYIGTVLEPLEGSDGTDSGWMLQLTEDTANNKEDVGKYLLKEGGTFLNALSGKALIQGDKIWTGLPAGYDRENDLPGVTFTVLQSLPGSQTETKVATLTITPKDWHEIQSSGQYQFTIQYQGENTVHVTENAGNREVSFHPEGNPEDWEFLPKYDNTNGNLYEYKSSEDIVFSGGDASDSLDDDAVFVGSGSGFSFTNQYTTEKNLVPFAVTKHLYLPKDTSGNYVFPAVTFQLTRIYQTNNHTTSAPESLGTFTWSSRAIEDIWEGMTSDQQQAGYITGTILLGNQEIYAPNGSPYVYTVTEVKNNLAGFNTWAAAGELTAGEVMIDENLQADSPAVGSILLTDSPEGTSSPVIRATFANQRMEEQQYLTAIQGTKVWKDFGNHFALRAENFTNQVNDGKDGAITLKLYRRANSQPGQSNAIEKQEVQGVSFVPDSKPADNGVAQSVWYYEFVAQGDHPVLEQYAPNGMPWIYIVEEELTGALEYYDAEKGIVEQSAQMATSENNILTLTLPELVNSLERTIPYSKTWVDKNGKPIMEDVLGYSLQVNLRLDVAEYTRTLAGTDSDGKPVYSYTIVNGDSGWKSAEEYFDPQNGNITPQAYTAVFGGGDPPFHQTLEGHLGNNEVWDKEFNIPAQLPVAIRKGNDEITLLTYRIVETDIYGKDNQGQNIISVSLDVVSSDEGKKYTYRTQTDNPFFTPVYYPDGLTGELQTFNHSYTRNLYNTLDEAQLVVTKQWVGDNQNAYHTRPATTRSGYTWQTSFLIQRTITPQVDTSWEHVYIKEGKASPLIVTLYGNNEQDTVSLEVSGLPDKDGNGSAYTYRIRELSADLNWVDTTDPQVAAAIQNIAEQGDQSEFVLDANARYHTAYTVSYPNNNFTTAINTLHTTQLYASKEWVRDENLDTGVTFQLQYQTPTGWKNISAPAGTVYLNGEADTRVPEDPSYELSPETTSPFRWMAVWENLPLRMPGSLLENENDTTNYRIVETVANSQGGNYIQSGQPENYQVNGENYIIWRFINTQKTSFRVTKTWGLFPGVSPKTVTVGVYRTTNSQDVGKKIDSNAVPATSGSGQMILTFRSGGTQTVNNLPKYNANGQLYYYYALELGIQGVSDPIPAPENGSSTVGSGNGRFDIHYTWNTGSSSPHETQIVNVGYQGLTVTKLWKDNSDAYGTRPKDPNDLKLTLYRTPAGGDEETVSITQPDWTMVGDTWICTYTGLPMADAQGHVYTYRIEESLPALPNGDWYEEISGNDADYNLTNILRNTVDIPVTKVWDDNGDAFGYRPDEITLELYANDSETPERTYTLHAPSFISLLLGEEKNTWRYIFEDLPKYDESGKLITYTVKEILTQEDEERYTVTVYPESTDTSNLPEKGFTLTNTGEGRLLITKKVTGSRGDHKKDFTFTAVFTDENGKSLTDDFPYKKILQDGTVETGTIISGEGFQLKDGESIQIDSLPGGTHYTVTESDNDDYRVSASGASGEIVPGMELTAAFENYRGGGGYHPRPDPDPDPDPTKDPEPLDPTPVDPLPHTGQNWILPIFLAAGGGLLIGAGTWVNRRERGRHHDS